MNEKEKILDARWRALNASLRSRNGEASMVYRQQSHRVGLPCSKIFLGPAFQAFMWPSRVLHFHIRHTIYVTRAMR